MLLVAINGSPRKRGSTAYLLKVAAEEAAQMGVETVTLHAAEGVSATKHPFCLHCSTPCKGTCYEGSLLAEMFNALRRADAVILGSPVYFGTVSGPLKAFWDKTRKLRKEFALYNVVGAAVTTGGSRFGGQELTARALQDMMLVQGMIIVGDGYTGTDAGHFGACGQAPAKSDPEAVKRTRILVHRVVEVARATEALRLEGRASQR
ncbi:MAG: flavodoxin family protein [Thermoanaerobacterales bacterium]|nr:flavodoxin family protein [Bacillota bacterium]MDI6907860.1 flavodoxin family protein [Thermoanaerobacterales bacterium]